MHVGFPEGHHRETARRNGFLLSFVSEVPSVFVSAPPGYSRADGIKAATRYAGAATTLPSPRPRVNLIVYLVVALMDPNDLGWHYTSEPLPHLRALAGESISGH